MPLFRVSNIKWAPDEKYWIVEEGPNEAREHAERHFGVAYDGCLVESHGEVHIPVHYVLKRLNEHLGSLSQRQRNCA